MNMMIRRPSALSALGAFDRLFEEAWREMSEGRENAYALALDVHENDTEYTVVATLPGVKLEDIDVRLHEGVLTISARIEETRHEENERVLLRERRFGQFARSLRLPAPVNADDIEATYEDGVVTLRIPKAEEAKPRTITVKSAGKR